MSVPVPESYVLCLIVKCEMCRYVELEPHYVDELPLAAVGLCRRTISSTFAILAASCGLGAWGLGEREPNRIGLDAETRPLLPLYWTPRGLGVRLSSCAATEAAAGLGNRSNPLNGCAFGLAAFAFGGFASGGLRVEGDPDDIVGA